MSVQRVLGFSRNRQKGRALKNLARALHADSGGCRLSLGEEVKTKIPCKDAWDKLGTGEKYMASPVLVGPKCNVRVSCDGNPRYDGFLAVDPTDSTHMVGICRLFQNAPQYQDQLEVQTTFDGGRSWSSTVLPNATGSISTSDPWLGIGPTGSEVYVVALLVGQLSGQGSGSMAGAASLFYSSNDGGITWLGPRVIFNDTNFGANDTLDGTFGAVDLSTQGASSHHGRIYAVWNHNISNSTILGNFPAFARSDNGGATWQPSSTASNGFDWEATGIPNWDHLRIVVGPDGVVHIASYASNQSQIVYGRSTDGGDNFAWAVLTSAPNFGGEWQIPSLSSQNPNLVFYTVPVLAFVVGPNGKLAIAWCMNASANPGPPAQVFVAQCTDNGVGWSQGSGLSGATQSSGLLPLAYAPTNLPQASTDFYFKPQLAFAPDGTLGCFANHYGSQNTPPMDGYLWVSQPGSNGVFNAATLVVSQTFDPTLAPIWRFNHANWLYYGDFIGLAASNLGFFPYWSDTRSGSAQLYVSRLAVNPADTYLRHFASDNGSLGSPGPGESEFDSPDLVVRLQQDGTTNFANQVVNTNSPQDLYIYGRVWNNGPNSASNIPLSACLGAYAPGTIWLYPHDWFENDWDAADQATHTWLGSVSAPGPLAPQQSVILGPITIPQADFNWGSFGHPCILAKVETDNDDSNGGASYGCALPAFPGVCNGGAYFWGTNNACQRNINYIAVPFGGGPFGPISFWAGNRHSHSEDVGLMFETLGLLKGIPIQLHLKNPHGLVAESVRGVFKTGEDWILEGPRPALRFSVKRGTRVELEMSLRLPMHARGKDLGTIRVSQVGRGGEFQGGVEFVIYTAR